jgi:hypothetical protein
MFAILHALGMFVADLFKSRTGDPPILLSIQKKWPRILARLDD